MTVRQFRMDQILKEIRKERLYQCFVTWLTGCESGGLGKLGAFCHVLYKYCFPIFMFVFVLQKFQIIMQYLHIFFVVVVLASVWGLFFFIKANLSPKKLLSFFFFKCLKITCSPCRINPLFKSRTVKVLSKLFCYMDFKEKPPPHLEFISLFCNQWDLN